MPSIARPSVLISVWLVAAALLAPGVAMADDCADGPNVADHPAVPRYAGACLIGSEQKSFEISISAKRSSSPSRTPRLMRSCDSCRHSRR